MSYKGKNLEAWDLVVLNESQDATVFEIVATCKRDEIPFVNVREYRNDKPWCDRWYHSEAVATWIDQSVVYAKVGTFRTGVSRNTKGR